ncbi:MAG TPA: LptF/LptG family permease [Rectinema sp.]|nr:LptF/LptG family permease [Rectinema sp.]HOO01112.1 LptF/LptG family permease [Rectinema sp.]HPY05502.1 LptF/LptG family permease [Rectinema sp.]
MERVFIWTIGGTLFLSLVISLVELFSLLWKFLAQNALFWDIIFWISLGITDHIVDALPVAFLFAIVFVLSDWHANHELEAVFSAGLSLQRLLIPILSISILFCAAEFYLTDFASIPFSRSRNDLQSRILKESAGKQTVPGLIVDSGKQVYTYRYFDEKNLRLYDVSVIERDAYGNLTRKISAESAKWEQGTWVFANSIIYSRQDNDWTFSKFEEYSEPVINEPPSSFTRPSMNPRFLTMRELNNHIEFLKASGLPVVDAEVEKQKRLSFSLTPLIVVGLAAAFSGRFRKSVFLLSLLLSLCSATLYYVAQMIASVSARSGLISPRISMWAVIIVFGALSTISYLSART